MVTREGEEMNELAIQQSNDGCLRELALFAGAGGGILGGHLLGWRTVCAVERDAYAAQVLAQRQNDGILQPFPIWSDVCSFDGKSWRGIVDVVSGGFPCQDISVAGKGAGINGARSGMWEHMARIVGDVRPRFVFVENSPALLTRGLGRVLSDLAALGYDCCWTVLGAADLGAPHRRDRFWLVAHSNGMRELQPQRGQQDERGWSGNSGEVFNTNDQAANIPLPVEPKHSRSGFGGGCNWWNSEPDVGRVANGVAYRNDRIKAIGNGQVSIVAATAFHILSTSLIGDQPCK